MVEKERQARVYKRWVRASGGGKAALDQSACAMADHGANGPWRHRRPAECPEDMVERGGQVWRSIDEGAVEIEDDGIESGHGGGGFSRGGACGKARPMQTVARGPVAAVILAAGKGTRMRSDRHKVLHPVGGRPMLLHLLDAVQQAGIDRVMVVVGDRADQVRLALAGTGADIAVQQPQLGTGHAVLQARDGLAGFAGTVLVLFADVPLVSAETMSGLVAKVQGDCGIAVLGFRPAEPGAYGRILADAGGRVLRMVEARDATPEELEVRLCNSGIMAVRSDILWPLLAEVGNANAAGEYYLPDIVMLGAANGIETHVMEGAVAELAGVNSRADLARVEEAFQAMRRRQVMDSGVTLLAPDTVFLAHDTRFGRDCLVEPFVVFGPGVSIGDRSVVRSHSHIEGATIAADCSVGPFARLRPGTKLGTGARIGNFVETKAAEIAAGAKANHLSYLGDCSVGADANIGAGTITCNYDGYGKHRTDIGAGAFIGSNSALVAPVSIGERAIVGAGSAITGDVPADALGLARGRQEVKSGWAARFHALMSARKDRHG
jgi:bifunctional UDP-N-acetylglucosamine pyrophosphorylase/glucosamine-1-phosphate N-acetyltransferase